MYAYKNKKKINKKYLLERRWSYPSQFMHVCVHVYVHMYVDVYI